MAQPSDKWLPYYQSGNVKEYSFSGSLGAERSMWNKYMKAMDSGDYKTAASVYYTLEQNNWHKMNEAMEAEGNKPASERGSYYDHAEDWTGKSQKAELRRMARRDGHTLPSDRVEQARQARLQEAAKKFSARMTPEMRARHNEISKAFNRRLKANAVG